MLNSKYLVTGKSATNMEDDLMTSGASMTPTERAVKKAARRRALLRRRVGNIITATEERELR